MKLPNKAILRENIMKWAWHMQVLGLLLVNPDLVFFLFRKASMCGIAVFQLYELVHKYPLADVCFSENTKNSISY